VPPPSPLPSSQATLKGDIFQELFQEFIGMFVFEGMDRTKATVVSKSLKKPYEGPVHAMIQGKQITLTSIDVSTNQRTDALSLEFELSRALKPGEWGEETVNEPLGQKQPYVCTAKKDRTLLRLTRLRFKSATHGRPHTTVPSSALLKLTFN